MKVAVIIPAYNRAATLERSVESVLNQTIPVDEIIIVNDASSDNTSEVARDLCNTYRNIQLIDLESNSGAPVARNAGATASKSHFLSFLDSDDVLKPSKIEKQIDILSKNPASPAAFCGFEYHYTNRPIRISTPPPTVEASDLWGRNILGGTSCVLVRRSAFETVGGFLAGLPSCQDWELWLRLAALGPLTAVQEALVEYHFDGGGRISKNRSNVEAGHGRVFDLVNSSISDPETLRSAQASQCIRMAEVYAKQFNDGRATLEQVHRALSLHPNARNLYGGFKAIANLLVRN